MGWISLGDILITIQEESVSWTLMYFLRQDWVCGRSWTLRTLASLMDSSKVFIQSDALLHTQSCEVCRTLGDSTLLLYRFCAMFFQLLGLVSVCPVEQAGGGDGGGRPLI